MRPVIAPLALAALAAASSDGAAKRPNALIVMADDQGLGAFSVTGNPVLKSPHLDAFAKQSVAPGSSRRWS